MHFKTLQEIKKYSLHEKSGSLSPPPQSKKTWTFFIFFSDPHSSQRNNSHTVLNNFPSILQFKVKLKGVIVIAAAAVHFKVDLSWCLKLEATFTPLANVVSTKSVETCSFLSFFTANGNAPFPQNLETNQIKTNLNSKDLKLECAFVQIYTCISLIHKLTELSRKVLLETQRDTTRIAFRFSTLPSCNQKTKMSGKQKCKKRKTVNKAKVSTKQCKFQNKSVTFLPCSTLLLKSKLVWLVSPLLGTSSWFCKSSKPINVMLHMKKFYKLWSVHRITPNSVW